MRGRNGPFDEDADEREEVDSSDRRDAFLDSRSIICLLAFYPLESLCLRLLPDPTIIPLLSFAVLALLVLFLRRRRLVLIRFSPTLLPTSIEDIPSSVTE